jgi:hypothetical protein
MMLLIKDNLTHFIIMVNFGQDHEDTVREASPFNPLIQVVLVTVDTVDKNGEFVVDDHVFDGFGVDAVYV